MIGRLRGEIIVNTPPLLLIEVGGVSYEVWAPQSTFYQLPQDTNFVTLHTHFVVREDAQILYGFYSEAERTLFRALIKINGVGPKLALAILSAMPVAEFITCLRQDDVSRLQAIPGIGQKTAQRLLVETKALLQSNLAVEVANQALPLHAANQTMQDAIQVLQGLGYKPQDAKNIVQRVYQPGLSSEKLIRLALQQNLSSVAVT